VAARVADTGEGIVLDVEGDDSSAVSVGAGERGFQAVCMRCDLKALFSKK